MVRAGNFGWKLLVTISDAPYKYMISLWTVRNYLPATSVRNYRHVPYTVGLINIATKTPVPAPVLKFSIELFFHLSDFHWNCFFHFLSEMQLREWKKFQWKPGRWKNNSMENFRTGAVTGILVAIYMGPTVYSDISCTHIHNLCAS